MPEIEVFSKALGLEKPWFIRDVKLDTSAKRLDIYLDRTSELLPCPVCSKQCSDYDSSEKEWRHLDFFQFEAHIHACIPRIECRNHGIRLAEVPWSRKASGFTRLFEFLAIQLSEEMPVASAATILRIGEDSLWRILKHYVERARAAMDLSMVRNLSVDEFAIQKGHNYETIFYDLDQGRVIHTEEGKRNTVFRGMKKRLPQPEKVETVSMDMAKPFILGASKYFPNASIAFDHFHVIKDMNDIVDRIRRREQKDNALLKSSKYLWLKNPDSLSDEQKSKLHSLKRLDILTARAYHFRIALQRLWNIPIALAEGYLGKWISWALRSGIKEISSFARSLGSKMAGILCAIRNGISNAMAEGINNKIRTAFKRAYGFKSADYRDTIIFLVAGKLDLPTLY